MDEFRWFANMLCGVGGHRYVVERRMNHGARKVGCTRCGRHWAMHDATRTFVPWNGEFEAMYAPGGSLGPSPAASGNDANSRSDEK